MRWAYGVLIAAVAALSLAATTQAAPRPEPAPAGLPSAQVALERALGYFAPAQARASFRRAAKNDPRGATIALRDLAAAFDSLSGANRRLAADILARPTDTGSGNYTAPRGDFQRRCVPNFCVHWVTSTGDRPSLSDISPANGIPDWIDSVQQVMSKVWNKEITDLGYKKPKADGPTGGHRGGNPNTRLDIFIQNVGADDIYGYCTTDDPRRSKRRDVSAYCVLDDDYSANQFGPPGSNGVDALKVTAAHEFHHASQFAYDWKEDRAFMEGSATNMEGTVYPAIPDNYQYFGASPLNPTNNNNVGPWLPVDLFHAQLLWQYGTWIWYRFLEEYFGSPLDPSINLDIWEQAAAVPGTNKGGKYSTRAMRAAVAARGANFDAAFAEFGWANASPDDWYLNGDEYPTPGYFDRGTFGLGEDDFESWPAFHFSTDYLRFEPSSNASTITFTFNFPDTVRGSNATVLRKNLNGTVAPHLVTLNENGNGTSAAIPFDDAVVSEVVLVITNDSTRMKNCGSHSFNETVTFACRGDARDDFLNGGFNYTATVD